MAQHSCLLYVSLLPLIQGFLHAHKPQLPGPAKAVMVIVVSQLAVAYMIELLGIFGVEKQPFEWRKIMGMLICAAGIVIFKWQN